jgi:hypothetical protein
MESPQERGTSIEVEIPLVNRRTKLASARRGRRQRWSVGSVWGAEANNTGVTRFGLR